MQDESATRRGGNQKCKNFSTTTTPTTTLLSANDSIIRKTAKDELVFVFFFVG